MRECYWPTPTPGGSYLLQFPRLPNATDAEGLGGYEWTDGAAVFGVRKDGGAWCELGSDGVSESGYVQLVAEPGKPLVYVAGFNDRQQTSLARATVFVSRNERNGGAPSDILLALQVANDSGQWVDVNPPVSVPAGNDVLSQTSANVPALSYVRLVLRTAAGIPADTDKISLNLRDAWLGINACVPIEGTNECQ